MTWINSSLRYLKTAFKNDPFSTKQAVLTLKKDMKYTDNTTRQVLYELLKIGALIKMGRGLYRITDKKSTQTETITISDKTIDTLTSDILNAAEKLLKERGVEFMVTGPSVLSRFFHHLPRRFMHLLYVVDGAGEFTSTILREEGFQVLLNPKSHEIDLMLQSFEDRDIFIIREYANLQGNAAGRAILEKALVDTYFEATRHRIPFPEMEVGRIIANAFRAEKIDVTKLLSLAGRRGIKGEMQTIVKLLVPSLPLPPELTNEKFEQVIKGIEA